MLLIPVGPGGPCYSDPLDPGQVAGLGQVRRMATGLFLLPESSEPILDTTAVQADVESFIDCPTGTVEHYFDSNVFNWSDELYRIHGYARGDVVPTFDLGISHIEPEDREAAAAFWDELSTTGGPLSVYLSLRDAAGRIRKVLISGDLIHDGAGMPVGVWALVVDATSSIHADTRQIANEAVAASAVSRAVIEQAKGILIGRAGLDATEAFERISKRSQTTNRKVVVIAQEIIDRALRLTRDDEPAARTRALLDLFQTDEGCP
jgi:hypothetical protein